MAFFFCKGHHLQPKGQATSRAGQFAHASHGHQNAQAAIVFATVAHRVVVAAGEQGLGTRGCGQIAPNHIAHVVDVDLVKPAGLHAQLQGLGAALVGLGEVGDGEFAPFPVALVTESGQPLVPIPHFMAQLRVQAQLVVEANLNDAVNVANAFFEFEIGGVVQAPLEGFDDLFPAQTQAAWAANGQDERPAKLGVVGGIEGLNLGKLFGGAMGQARTALLVGGFGGEGFADHGLASQLRVSPNQVHFGLASGLVQDLNHGVLQAGCGGEGALAQGALGNPVGVFVKAAELRSGLGQWPGVDVG